MKRKCNSVSFNVIATFTSYLAVLAMRVIGAMILLPGSLNVDRGNMTGFCSTFPIDSKVMFYYRFYYPFLLYKI